MATAEGVLLILSVLTCVMAGVHCWAPGKDRSTWSHRRRRRAISVVLGAFYGLGMRLLFLVPEFLPWTARAVPAPVSITFLTLVPMSVGAIAVYFGDPEERLRLSYQVRAAATDICVFLALTALAFLEGTICIVMALPIFLIMAIVGALMMGLLLRTFGAARGTVACFFALPLLIAPAENALGYRSEIREIRLQTTIHARPGIIWGNIMNARDIRPEELGSSWVYSIGVPRPIEGLTERTANGEIRRSRWSHGVRFDEKILAQIPERSVLWDFHFDAKSIPPGVLDEHVRIGGRYFDLVDTRYDILPLQSENSRLMLTAHYRVSSSFNAYARVWADLMLRDAGKAVLHFYKTRSEAMDAAAAAQNRGPG